MPLWNICLISGAGALVVEIVGGWLRVRADPAGYIWAGMVRDMPEIVANGLASYAIFVMVLATAAMLHGLRRVDLALAQFGAHAAPTYQGWAGIFEAACLSRLASQLIHLTTATSPRGTTVIILGDPVNRYEARRAINRFYNNRLVRAQFFTAAGCVVVISALGLTPPEPLARILPGMAFPSRLVFWALAIVLASAFGRLAVQLTGNAVADMVAALPTEPIEIQLLRRIVALLESAPNTQSQTAGAPPAVLLERLVSAIEGGQRSLIDAVASLPRTAALFEVQMQSAVTRIEEAGRTAVSQMAESGGDAVKSDRHAAFHQTSNDHSPPDGNPGTRAQGEAGHVGLENELRKLIAEVS
jgi:hypothetical protein